MKRLLLATSLLGRTLCSATISRLRDLVPDRLVLELSYACHRASRYLSDRVANYPDLPPEFFDDLPKDGLEAELAQILGLRAVTAQPHNGQSVPLEYALSGRHCRSSACAGHHCRCPGK